MAAVFERSSTRNSNALVVICGFGGSKLSQLSKYSKLYEDEGYETAIFISPILAIRKFNDLWPFAEELYICGDFENEGNRPIIFHIMSMIGITTFAAFWELLSQKPNGHRIKAQVIGLVFDSGPTRIATPTTASRAVIKTLNFGPKQQSSTNSSGNALSMSNLYSNIMQASTYCLLFTYYSYLKLLTKVSTSWRHEICTFYRMQQTSDFPVNQLYLYSQGDDVIDYKQVEEFIRFQQKRPNAMIYSKRWGYSSPHVQHLLKQPDEYKQLCVNFASRLFNSNKAKL